MYKLALLAKKAIQMKYPNFYETLKEALARLRDTVVMYDGQPHTVLTITNHKPDGKFRIYLRPTGIDDPAKPVEWYPEALHNYGNENPAIGPMMDTWLETSHGKSSKVIRKSMDSSLFNKFRPYPLGMCNYGKNVYYVERQPNRKMEQGLIRSMLDITELSMSPETNKRGMPSIELNTPAFRSCVLGEYPSSTDCLAAMSDPSIINTGVGFSRDFALLRGPIDMLFIAYKSDIVGVLPKRDFSVLRLGRGFHHVKEVAEKLGIFGAINA